MKLHFRPDFRMPAWLLISFLLASTAVRADKSFDELLARTSQQTAVFLQQFSEAKCTEKVSQVKLYPNGKVERTAESSYDYLVILTNNGGELNLSESRLELHPAKVDKQKTSLLVSNGFATLFLIFHPYYSASFEFTALDDETVDGTPVRTIAFRHIRGTKSPAALSLRGREYPLELSGKAWVDPRTGSIVKMTATIGSSMEDVGLKAMESEVTYAAFHSQGNTYWFPAKAVVDVETPRQHWHNTHMFSYYKLFSVDTEEKVVANK